MVCRKITKDISVTCRTLMYFERKGENTSDQAIKDQVAEVIEKVGAAGGSISDTNRESTNRDAMLNEILAERRQHYNRNPKRR